MAQLLAVLYSVRRFFRNFLGYRPMNKEDETEKARELLVKTGRQCEFLFERATAAATAAKAAKQPAIQRKNAMEARKYYRLLANRNIVLMYRASKLEPLLKL
jgi:hypothetical protein